MGDCLIVLAYLHWIRLHAGRFLGQLNQIGKRGDAQRDAIPAWQGHRGQSRVSLE